MSKKDILKNLQQPSFEATYKEANTLKITEEWIEDKITNLFVILNILKPSSNDVENIKTFIRTLYREAGCQLKED